MPTISKQLQCDIANAILLAVTSHESRVNHYKVTKGLSDCTVYLDSSNADIYMEQKKRIEQCFERAGLQVGVTAALNGVCLLFS